MKLEDYCGPENPLVPAEEGDVGCDLYSTHPLVLEPGQRALVGTGLKIALPKGMEGQIRPKSGRAWNDGLTVLNTPGTIDPGYRGEVKVLLYNSKSSMGLFQPQIRIKAGEKIAQIVFKKFERPEIQVVSSEEELGQTARGDGGFGSTGVT